MLTQLHQSQPIMINYTLGRSIEYLIKPKIKTPKFGKSMPTNFWDFSQSNIEIKIEVLHT